MESAPLTNLKRFVSEAGQLSVDAPNLIDIVDVIAIPRLALFFGSRLLHFGTCAIAKACHEKSKRVRGLGI